MKGGDSSGSELVMDVNQDAVSSLDNGAKFNDELDRCRISLEYASESRERERRGNNSGLALPATAVLGVTEPFAFGFPLKLVFLLGLHLDL